MESIDMSDKPPSPAQRALQALMDQAYILGQEDVRRNITPRVANYHEAVTASYYAGVKAQQNTYIEPNKDKVS